MPLTQHVAHYDQDIQYHRFFLQHSVRRVVSRMLRGRDLHFYSDEHIPSEFALPPRNITLSLLNHFSATNGGILLEAMRVLATWALIPGTSLRALPVSSRIFNGPDCRAVGTFSGNVSGQERSLKGLIWLNGFRANGNMLGLFFDQSIWHEISPEF